MTYRKEHSPIALIAIAVAVIGPTVVLLLIRLSLTLRQYLSEKEAKAKQQRAMVLTEPLQ